jgi:thioredoxin 1
MSHILEVTDATFEETILRADKLAILDFGAEWCAPCKKVEAMLEDLAPKWQDKAVIGSLDISKSPETPRRYGVLNIPQVLFFKGGSLVETVIGVLPRAKFEEKMKNHSEG